MLGLLLWMACHREREPRGRTPGEDGGSGDAGLTDGGSETPTTVDHPEERSCAVRLEVEVAGSPSRVEVAGSFNSWSPEPMSLDGGRWVAELGELPAGSYAWKILVDGAWETEIPADVEAHWLDGVENRNLRVGDCRRPTLGLEEAWATGEGELYARVQFVRAAGGASLDPESVELQVGGNAVPFSADPETGLITVALGDLPQGKHSLRLSAADADGLRTERDPLFVPLWVEAEPFTWDEGLIYFVFTDRFRDGDVDAPRFSPVEGVADCANYNGGDFLGVIHALQEGWFSALGVNTLWLSPLTENPEGGFLGIDGTHLYSGYHGYWPVEPLEVEERFGDAEADAAQRLHELVALAHEQGIRVMFDLTLNHVHEQHRYVQEHPEWFGEGCVCGTEGCGWDEMARTCWFVDYLPDLDYRNHEITERVLADTLALLAEYDVDAVRVDAAKHMDHVIMRSLRQRLEGELSHPRGPEWYLVGETFSFDRELLMDYVGEHELHGQFDFPMMSAVRQAFIHGGSFRDLEASVAAGQASYGQALMSPFFGNHDVERFATEATGAAGDCWSGWIEDPMAEGGAEITQWDLINRQSMALAFTLTQPGVPLLYYGDEIGLHGGGDPDNRRPMNFPPYLSANQQELLSRAQVVGRARAASEALRRGERLQLWVDDDLLVYARALGEELVIVALNKSDAPRSEAIPLQGRMEAGSLVDLKVDGRGFTVSGGSLQLSLGGWDWAILRSSW